MRLVFCDVCGTELEEMKISQNKGEYYKRPRSFELVAKDTHINYPYVCQDCYGKLCDFGKEQMKGVKKNYKEKFPFKQIKRKEIKIEK